MQHYTTAIFSIPSSWFWHIFYLRYSSACQLYLLKTLCVRESRLRKIVIMSSEICRIDFLLGRQTYLLFVHPTNLIWQIFYIDCMSGRFIWPLAIFEKISNTHLTPIPGLLLDWSLVLYTMSIIQSELSVTLVRLDCLHSEILISLVYHYNAIVLMDSSNHVTLFLVTVL